MEYNKTIYKKDIKSKIRFLTIESNKGYLRQYSGIVGTSNPIFHEKLCKGKNIGRSNETTPEQQSIKEAEALYKDKLTKGYFNTIEEAENEEVILPMLAKDYKKESHKIDWKSDYLYVQRKFDGMRCLAFIKKDGSVKLLSREGKEIQNMDHIKKELSLIKRDIILDGELYTHEDFQTNMSYIKDYQPGLSEKINYHVYDIVSDKPFKSRNIMLSAAYWLIKEAKNFKYIKKVETEVIRSEEHLKLVHSKFLSEGYEGTMLRISKSGYKVNGRSSELLKYKDFLDLSLPILDIIPCKVKTDWGEPIFYWEGAKGHRSGKDRLGSGTRMNHEMRKDLLLNKENYIGKIAEVRFFEYSNTGVPRFPIVVGIRLDKSKPDEI